MYHLALDLALALLISRCLCSKDMSQIPGILVMLQYNDITTGKASLMSNICNRFCNVLNTFACNSKQNITVFEVFGTWHILKFGVRNTLIKPSIVGSINFTISDTGNAFLGHLVTFDSRTSEDICCNFPKGNHRNICFRL